VISQPLAERSRLAGGPKRPWGVLRRGGRCLSIGGSSRSRQNGLDAPREPDGLVTVPMLPRATSSQRLHDPNQFATVTDTVRLLLTCPPASWTTLCMTYEPSGTLVVAQRLNQP
jgi:hypothetical protein